MNVVAGRAENRDAKSYIVFNKESIQNGKVLELEENILGRHHLKKKKIMNRAT